MKNNFPIMLFKYFAKFPELSGVLRNFQSLKNTKHDMYAQLKTEIETADNSLIPEIKEFIFGTHLDLIKQRFKNIFGNFMFVEYFESNISENQYKHRDNKMRIAVHIGSTFSEKNNDSIEELIVMDELYGIIEKLLKQIQTDTDERCVSLQYITYPVSIQTIESQYFNQFLGANCIGYTILFEALYNK